VCNNKWALALYSSSSVFPITPTTNSEGYNIFWSPTTQEIIQYGGGSIGTVAEFVNAMKPQYGYGVQTLQTDPMLVNPGGNPPDFRLKAGSPAAGSADPGHLAPADVTGAKRSTADRGAYAQGSGGRPTTTTTLPQTGAPAPPKLLRVDPH
jgi:hypothetical protein